MPDIVRPEADRFWRHVNTEGPITSPALGPCWLWTGATTKYGYGVMYTRRDGRPTTMRPHDWAYESVHGPLNGARARQMCGVRACVRPAHQERAAPSRRSRGLPRPYSGRPHYRAKLAMDQVAEVRRRWEAADHRRGARVAENLAAEYGITRQQVYNIVRGAAWRVVA